MQLKKFIKPAISPFESSPSHIKVWKDSVTIFFTEIILMNPSQTILNANEAEILSGDFHPLLDQIGSAEGLALVGVVNASLVLEPTHDFTGLKRFLENYRTQLLVPLELPLICQAFAHASRNEFSELISLDQQQAHETRLEMFVSASKRIGKVQLRRLRPLRDQRGLQRYIRAVDAGEASAWHTIVYGVTLASFSMPLRQGLLNYSARVLSGFVQSSGGFDRFAQLDCETLIEENLAAIPPEIDRALLSGKLSPNIQFP